MPVELDLCILSESGTRLAMPLVIVTAPELGVLETVNVPWETGVVSFSLLRGRYEILIANGEHRVTVTQQLTESTRRIVRVESEPYLDADNTSGCVWPESKKPS